jgi:hypothetical protein
MTDKDFEYGGRKFKLGKMNTFKQFHVVRRISPILADLLPAIKDIQKLSKNKNSESEKFEETAKILGPILTGFSKLSDTDSEFVLFGLLSSVEVQLVPGSWAKVSTDTMLMVQDFDLPALLQIAGRAFIYNLSGFFAALPATQPQVR